MKGPIASGRTWRQLQALPDGGIYFIPPCTAMRRHCQQILVDQGRGHEAVRLVMVDGDTFRRVQRLRGKPYAVDHAVPEHARMVELEELRTVCREYLGFAFEIETG